uniref:UEV domain-containing protein n=1 Tax=Rhizochromulina marina TaxID=1034831 RepID=A0A7S2RRB3_9STRA|mmetsp:Transcript_19827/g.57902  ORF Transcript_19827/g.57902 Transcript_19827/m.57902 type:complete len:379 (+) Transcript_19827:313-1449(+)
MQQQQQQQPPRFSLLKPKRKSPVASDEETVEHFKRFRITVAPGELRLKHDMQEDALQQLCAAHSLDVQIRGRNPLIVRVDASVLVRQLQPSAERQPHAPQVFTIEIPRFYPHEAPLVYVDPMWSHHELWGQLIETSGKVTHPAWLAEWNATSSFVAVLTAVVYLVKDPRELLRLTPPPAPPPTAPDLLEIPAHLAGVGGGGGGSGRRDSIEGLLFGHQGQGTLAAGSVSTGHLNAGGFLALQQHHLMPPPPLALPLEEAGSAARDPTHYPATPRSISDPHDVPSTLDERGRFAVVTARGAAAADPGPEEEELPDVMPTPLHHGRPVVSEPLLVPSFVDGNGSAPPLPFPLPHHHHGHGHQGSMMLLPMRQADSQSARP